MTRCEAQAMRESPGTAVRCSACRCRALDDDRHGHHATGRHDVGAWERDKAARRAGPVEHAFSAPAVERGLMGIDDRDYMKARYWERQGKKPPSRWSFNKAECKAAEAKR